MDCTFHYDSPLGGITLAADGEGLTGLWFDDQKNFGVGLDPRCAPGYLPVFEDAARWLDAYFSGCVPDFTPPLHLRGTAFRHAVWAELLAIPFGKTATYGDIAARLSRGCAQAVGGALAHNPVSLIVPCHRIVGADGSLTGYAGGMDRKIWLLRMEGVLKSQHASLKGTILDHSNE